MEVTKRCVLAVVMAAGFACAAPALAQSEKPAKGEQPTTPAKHAAPAKPTATEKGQPTDKAPAGMDAEMEAWTKANQINENHITLAKDMVGRWDTKTTFWMAPGAPPMESTGKAVFDAVLGGRYVTTQFTGEMMGKEFKGLGTFGYNNATKQFESVWIDNESTGFLFTTGTKDAKGAINWTGSFTDPVTGQKKAAKAVSRKDGADKMFYEMWEKTSDGTEFKSLEVAYTRAAGGPAFEKAIDAQKQEKKAATPPADKK